ncbi:MAG TPA: hypothetical protein VH302_02775 [Bryobacteraceae bacterium]|nr:hypothetical protein [Bryobacteraceae bacterium]
MSIQTEIGPIDIDVAEPVLDLARHLRLERSADVATNLLREVDSQLDVWENSRRYSVEREKGRAVLPFGVELSIPRGFGRTQ